MKKFLALLLLGLFVQQSAFAAWPSVSARSKDWGAEVLTDADLEAQLDLLHNYENDSLNSSTGHDHDGTTSNGPKIPLGSLTVASQATGDIMYASSASVWTRLGIGATGKVLSVVAGVPAWSTVNVAPNFRSEMNVMQASTTTLTVGPGSVEINNAVVSKTSNTTLTISTAGDWAGGVSQRATSTLAFVIIDASGNIKMTTTAPSHADYAVSVTAANNTKRYATVSGTVYRYLGWFYMNATGSGELDTFGVSNILDVGVRNAVIFQTGAVATGTTALPDDDTIPQNTEGDQFMSQVFRPTNVNNKLRIKVVFNWNGSLATFLGLALFQDSTAGALAATRGNNSNGAYGAVQVLEYEMKAATISLTTFKVRAGGTTGTITFNGAGGARIYGGVMNSLISIEEIPAQLT